MTMAFYFPNFLLKILCFLIGNKFTISILIQMFKEVEVLITLF